MPDITGQQDALFAFENFVFDSVIGELRKGGIRVRMGKQVSDLLAILIAHSGELVTREQIRSTLWPDQEQIDFEKVINNGISRLRFLLQDDPKNPRFIERIPKRGYRLLVAVERINRPQASTLTAAPRVDKEPVEMPAPVAEAVALPAAALFTDAEKPAPVTSSKDRPRLYLMAAVVLLAVVIGTVWALMRSHGLENQKTATPAVISLEVLPIEAESPDLQQLAAGFRLDLIDALSQLPQLQVRGQHAYPGARTGATVGPSDHDFQTLLYGKFDHSLTGLHLEFELVRASDGTHLSSFQYNGSQAEFAQIREKIQQDLFLRLQQARQRGLQTPTGTSNQEAYNDYLKARLSFWQQTNDSMKAAVEEYRSAIDHDGNFAAAHSGLARTLFVMGEHGIVPQKEAFAQATDEVNIALRLDPSSPEVNGTNGLLYCYRDWDVVAGERELRHAIQLDPTQAIYHQWLAVVLSVAGKGDEALEQIDLAHADAPNWPPVYNSEIFVAGNAGDMKRLLAAGRQLEALTANSPFARDAMANALWYSGKPLDAIHEWRSMAAAEHDPDRMEMEDAGLQAFLKGGVPAYARVRLKAIAQGKGTQMHPNDFSPIEWSAAAGDSDKAIAMLQALAAKRDPDFLENIQSPGLTNLRNDDRFKALLAEVGISISPGNGSSH